MRRPIGPGTRHACRVNSAAITGPSKVAKLWPASMWGATGALTRGADAPTTVWTTIVMPEWYGGERCRLQIAPGTAIWYRSGKPPVPTRRVLVRDPTGIRKRQETVVIAQISLPASVLDHSEAGTAQKFPHSHDSAINVLRDNVESRRMPSGEVLVPYTSRHACASSPIILSVCCAKTLAKP
jgi:hypothetical protein